MERLQYISQETETLSHLQGIQKACDAGVKWIQLRVKDKPENEILDIAEKAKNICDPFKARLIINDFPIVAKQVNAYGVHLGKEDLSVSEGRKILGNDFIIGGTANTIEDIQAHFNAGANYIGAGPFRFTSTKKKLSPVLGINGYRQLMEGYSKKNISIPVIAIGGIELDDIRDIMGTGVYGIAVSGLIAGSKNAQVTVKQILDTINSSIYSTC